MTGICIICGTDGDDLSKCKDILSWGTLYEYAALSDHREILALSSGKEEFPSVPVLYHRECRSNFTHKKRQSATSLDSQSSNVLLTTRSRSDVCKSDILPVRCIFCNKDKYKRKERTREKLRSVEEFGADTKIRDSALKHIEYATSNQNAAENVLLLLSKDLISSEAKYHASCYKNFVKIIYEEINDENLDNKSIEDPKHNPDTSLDSEVSSNSFYDLREKEGTSGEHWAGLVDDIHDFPIDELDEEVIFSEAKRKSTDSLNFSSPSVLDFKLLFQPVREFCEKLMNKPEIIEFKVVRKLVNENAQIMKIKLEPSYQKNLLRKVSSSIPGMRFVQHSGNCVLMYPSSLEIEDLVRKCHELSTELEKVEKMENDEKCIVNAGKILHKNITSHPEKISWPPKDHELKAENVQNCVPPTLDLFCKSLFNGSITDTESKRTFQRRNFIAQDLVYCVSKGRIKTPKSILFPSVVKALCNNIQVNKMINSMGLGISTNLIREIDTESALVAINQQLEYKVVIPEEEKLKHDDNRIALMVADNIDNLENTDTGFGTSHRVNSILITKTHTEKMIDENIHIEPPTKRKCLRSLPSDKVMQNVTPYFHGKRIGPGVLSHIKDLDVSTKYDELSEEQRMNFLVWISLRSLKTSPTLLVPGWTGFNILIRKNVVVFESKVTYLDTLDSPATDITTAYEVLCRACEVKDRLNLKSVLCVFDQAFYAKAAEVIWKHQEQFQDIVIMLGGFHLLMMYLAVLGIRYGDAGFKDITLQGEVIAEGSINKVLNGHHYNRAIRSHKIVYESLSRLLYERFLEWMVEEQPATVSQVEIILSDMKGKLKGQVDDFKDNDLIKNLNHYYNRYRKRIKTKGTHLQKFWFSYLEMVELLLNLVYATRTGDWEFYLACIEQVIPWAFAYDRQKYARFLLPYLNDMRSLPTEKPDVYAALCEGEFSVQMKNSNSFGRNEADKTIENTINRDCKTSGGYIGFSASFSTTQRWVLNAARRGHYKRMLMEQIDAKPKDYVHRELLPSAIKRDNALVEKTISVIEDIFLNPWEGDELISISSGIAATSKLIDDLLNARSKGMSECMKFISLRCSETPKKDFFDTLGKTKLSTFTDMKTTVTVSTKNKAVALKMDKDLFARITLLAQFRKIDMKLVFSYPLGPLPWAISDAFGMPRKTNKAAIMHKLEKDVTPIEIYPSDGSTIYDGMAVLQKFQPASRSKFGDVARSLFRQFTSTTNRNIHIVFDVYRNISIKNMERFRRSTGTISGVQYKNILPSYPVKSWNKLMASSQNKQEIVKFLVSEWKKSEYRSELLDKTIFVTEENICWKITSHEYTTVPELECTHEEADTRMILHAKYSSGPVIVHADDTDVLVLLLAHSDDIPESFMKVGKRNKRIIISINAIKARLMEKYSPDFLRALIGMHAFTGCDSVSSFAGKGKVKALNLLFKYPEFIPAFAQLGETWSLSEETAVKLEEFICTLYGKKMSNVDLLRYELFCSKQGKVEPEAIPPCRSSLLLHMKRANYQAGVWRRSLHQNPSIPSPDNHGWDITENDVSIKWLGVAPAPDEILSMISCLCKRSCLKEDCCCLQVGLKCTDLCSTKCNNMATEDLFEKGDEEDSDSSDVEDDV